MKTSVKVACSVTVDAVLGAGVYFVTKWKQEKARKENKHMPYGVYEAVMKRSLDVVISGMALVVLSLVMGIITLITAIKMKGNSFFMQRRPGKDEKIFQLIKFRSMTDERDQDGNLLPDAVRLTNYGKFLRTSSLDGRVIIGQTTESLENKRFREISPIHFRRGHDLFSSIADHANIEGVLCRSA